jgi:hypothetical protein
MNYLGQRERNAGSSYAQLALVAVQHAGPCGGGVDEFIVTEVYSTRAL